MAKIETQKPETQKPYDPMKDLVTVTLPRATGKEEDFVFVGLNGKGYNIKRGIPVRVPRPVYDILAERDRQIERQAEFEAKVQEQMAQSAQRVGFF